MREVLQTVTSALELRPSHERSERMRPRFITLAPARGARAVVQRRALATS